MKHLFFSTRLLCSLLLSMFLFLGAATPMWGEEETLTLATADGIAEITVTSNGSNATVNGVQGGNVKLSKGSVVVTTSLGYFKGSGTDGIQVYKNGSMTVSVPTNYKISKIVMTLPSGCYPFSEEPDAAWTLSKGKTSGQQDGTFTISPAASSVTFTNNSAGQTKVKKLVITYSSFAITSKVTLNTNGGTINSGNITEYTEGTGATLPTDVTKTGFSFDGWFDNSAFTGSAVTAISTSDKGDKEFWAKWTSLATEAYTVTFDGNGKGTPAENSLKEVSAGAGVTLPDCEANEGWVFKGWATTADATTVNAGVTGDIYHPTSDNTPLYAFYKVKPATPSFDPVAGAIDKGDGVSISCTTDGASIYYTLDGTTPTSESSAYSEVITINEAKTIKAIAILDGESSDVATAEYTIATHKAHFSVNGNIDNNKDFEGVKGATITFPAEDPEVDGVEFMGWASSPITGTLIDAPDMVTKANEKIGTDDVTYYAVFAIPSEGVTNDYKLVESPVGGRKYLFVTKNSTGSAHAFSSKSIMGVEVAVSEVKGEKVITNTNNDIIWERSTDEGTKSGSAIMGSFKLYNSTNSVYLKINGSAVSNNSTQCPLFWDSSKGLYGKSDSGTGSSSYYLQSSISGSTCTFNKGSGLTTNRVYAYENVTITYSDYCTTVALDPKPTIVLSETALTEYAGNTNNSITVSVSEQAYTGTLEASSDKEAVATASISDGRVIINALTAGTANITITAPAVTGFRKNTATIAVTVENKKAAYLVFAETTQTVSMDAEPFAAYTISSKATDAEEVTYSLDIKGDATGTPIASLSMVEGVPTITLSGSKATTDSRTIEVVATTEETHDYAAGEARYQLIVNKLDPQIGWSASEVTLDLNEEDQLPTLANPRNLAIIYNSTNKDVADFNEGVLVLKKAGTTTIQASIGSSGYYDATTVSYELTFAPTYTVSFKYTDDTKAAEDIREATTGAGVTLPTNPGDKEGYRFLGWATTKEATSANAGATGDTYKPSNNETLYAFYAQLYTAKFIVNGEQYGETQSLINGESVEFPATKPSDLGGKTFVGWAMEEVNGIDEIKPTTYTEFTIDNDDVTFFAVFATESGTALDYTFTIVPSNFVNGYDSNNGSHDITAKCITDNSKTLTISYATQSVGEVSGKIQFKKSGDGYLYNTTDLGSITSVTIADGSNLTTYYGTSQKPTSSTSVGTDNSYFRIVAGSSAGTCTSITVTFTKSDYTYSDYCTTVAGELSLVAQNNENGTNYYYATFSSEYDVEFGDDVEVNTVTVSGDQMTLIPVSSNQVPANTGVLIKSQSSNISYSFIAEATVLPDNMLKPGTGDNTTNDVDSRFYRLAYYDYAVKTGLGFYYGPNCTDGEAFKCKAGTAYLAVPKVSGNAPARFLLGRQDVPTDIMNINGYGNNNQGTKVMIDGRLYILRDGKTYDSFGRLVK